MADHEELTRAFQEAARRRADLRRALVDVERAISSPAAGRLQTWTGDVVKRLTLLRDSIDEHIEVTERSEGLYEEILHRAPRLSSQVDRLRAEHPALRTATADLIERLHSTSIGRDWPLDEARDDAQRLLGKIVKHRQQGADLVWEAYNLDIGGIE
jgi:hemerythrin-like domain-containing protein